MKRLVLGLIIGLVVALAILAMALVDVLYSPARSALGRYVRYYSAMEPGLRVSETVPSSRPGNFTPEMSGPVFDGSSLLNVKDTPAAGDQLRYPPEQLYCALLSSRQGSSVVYVALHTQLYYAQWLVHQATFPWPSGDLQTQLAIVGCNFIH
jgi:hypothetical protein